MRWIYTFCLFALGNYSPIGAQTATAPDYEFYFGEDYQAAIDFCESNQHWFWAAGRISKVEPALLTAILFPETLRYSLVKDLLETKALEYFYVMGGSQASDFSIGIFQMKPSFAEKLEAEIAKNEPWATTFKQALVFESQTAEGVRGERLQRLQRTEWQLVYACALCRMVEHRFSQSAEYQELGALRFTAAAYNGGFNKTAAEIKRNAALRMFPYGKNAAPETQYAYPDVALDYYNKYALSLYKKWEKEE